MIAIDLGNTRLKAGFFIGNRLVSVAIFNHDVLEEGDERKKLTFFINQDPNSLLSKTSDNQTVDTSTLTNAGDTLSFAPVIIKLIISSVIKLQEEFMQWLDRQARVYKLDHHMALPFINLYQSPMSLGSDRIAAVAGALSLYQGKDVLIINAGTAITYEFLNYKGEYLGGSISPGIHMRYMALHTFTSRLPLLELDENIPDLIGTDTVSSIRSGVQLNTLFELKEVITNYRHLYGKHLTICICGGDSKTFVTQLKNSIFADHLAWQPDLVLIGLNQILTFNNA